MTVDNQFILRKLQSLENATIVFSTVTKHPFLVCDEEKILADCRQAAKELADDINAGK